MPKLEDGTIVRPERGQVVNLQTEGTLNSLLDVTDNISRITRILEPLVATVQNLLEDVAQLKKQVSELEEKKR